MNPVFAHTLLLLRRLALAYLIYTFVRFLFFFTYFSTFSVYPFADLAHAFIQGLRFDTTAIAYLFSPVIVLHLLPLNARNKRGYQLAVKLVYLLGVFLSLLLNLVDVGYFAFSGKRSGMELVRMQQAQNASPLVYVTDHWYLLVLLLVLLAAVWKAYPRLKTGYHITGAKPLAGQLLLFVAGMALAAAGARGSLGLKPLNTLDAARFTSAELMPLTLNTPFQFILTVEQVGVTYRHYMSDEEARLLFTPEKTVPAMAGTGTKKNVVLIIAESLGKEYVGYYNNGKGYTPFLDSLMQHSTVYERAYANGKRSIEGIPSIIASMPSWMPSDYINSFYQSNTLHGVGYYLQKQGYEAGFYHGGKNGTMSFDKMVAATGTGTYYGLNEYPEPEKDFDGSWGIFDEPYLQYAAAQFTNRKQPFFGTVFTLSSHHPYALPAAYRSVFKGGPLPIHATIQYTDFALKRFFETARKMPWYHHTVFYITADHSSENTQPTYLTSAGRYAIPLVVFDPGKNQHQSVQQITDQLGIMDLILDANLPAGSDYFSFAGKYAIQYDNGVYQAIGERYVLQFDGERTIGFYDLGKDALMQANLVNDVARKTERDAMERELKAVIQQYNQRLIENKTH